MKEVSIVGLDLAKRVFQLHAASADGGLVFRRKLSRVHVLAFFSELPRCVFAMEACATVHYWAREIGKLGCCHPLMSSLWSKGRRVMRQMLKPS